MAPRRPPGIRPALTVGALVAALGLAACSSVPSSTGHATTPTTPSTASTTPGAIPDQTVGVARDGFAGRERFCASSPLIGSILYNGTSGTATLDLAVGGLPPGRSVEVNWLNNGIRGYVVASFVTDAHGVADQSSLRFYRPGEARGAGLVLTTATASDERLGMLLPCAE